MESKRVVRWGIIGAGDVCEVKSGPGFYKAPLSELRAITKRDPAAAEDFARRHGVARWYTDPSLLIADPDVDAVYVATPPHLHLHFAEAVLRAGKPVLVEKPMAMNAAECDRMLETAERAAASGVRMWVAYYRRALEKFIEIKRLVDGGAIGELRSVQIEFSRSREQYASGSGGIAWRVDPATGGAGIVADMGSHMLDLIDWIAGPIRNVYSHAVNRAGDYKAEDLISAVFLAGPSGAAGASGARAAAGSALWDFSGTQEIDRTVLRGSTGAIEYTTFSDHPARILRGSTVEELPRRPFPPHMHQSLIELINAEIRGGDPAPATAVSGARTNRVLDALVGAYYAAR